ncbi:MAG TPA: hypothetical protein VIK91_07625, partial [Nannocystis sp.]
MPPRRAPALAAALALLSAPAGASAARLAQAPPSPVRTGGDEPLAPMPSPPPVQADPPDLA